jgi:hypothetical protein
MIAKDPRNVIAANNMYDLEYIKFFTGIQPYYVPAYCGYVYPADYKPINNKILWARNHNNPSHHYRKLKDTARRKGFTKYSFVRTEDAYKGGFEYTDLAKHPAMVMIPYTKVLILWRWCCCIMWRWCCGIYCISSRSSAFAPLIPPFLAFPLEPPP